MNNEEKILAILEKHSKMFEKMQDDISGLKAGQSAMQDDISGLKAGQSAMQDDITAVKLRLELDVEKQFDAVNEGIDAILAQLTPKRKVEEMDADITVLKTAVKMLTQEVAELKKAQ